MTDLYVLGVGASTPLGLDARQTALCLRAAKGEPRPSPFEGASGQRLGTIRCRRLGDDVVGYDRFVALAAPALEEALLGDDDDRSRPTVLLVAVPERFEGEDERIGPELLQELAARCGLRLDGRSAAIPLGRAGFAAILGRALTTTGDVRIVVGGVDTFHDLERMRALDAGFRVLDERSQNGFIPSEGAAFARVLPAAKRPPNVDCLGAVRLVACGEEPEEPPPLAIALTKLLADPRLPNHVPWVLSDVNGERHRAREWTYAWMRNQPRFEEGKTRVDRPYDEIGELGASTGAIYLAYATMAFRLGFAPHDGVLVATASEGTARGIFVVEAAT